MQVCRWIQAVISNRKVLFIFCMVLGGGFVWSGLVKILDPLDFAQNITNYKIFSWWMAFFLALILPWIELICGIFLLLGIFRHASALMLAGLLISLLILIIVTIVRGIDVECGCFGLLSRKVDYVLILVDSILLFLALNVFHSYRNQRARN